MSFSENTEILCIKTGFMDNNTWLVYDKETKEGFIVDSSFNGEKIIEAIKSRGVELKGIFLTHGHYDHIYSVLDVKKAFPEANVYAGADEAELLSDPRLNLFRKHGLESDEVRADIYLSDGERVNVAGFDIEVIFTPGHTRGGVCYLLESEGCLFTGDTLFADSHGRTDLPTGDAAALKKSITEKLFTLNGDTAVYPGHGDASDIAYESRHNPILL